MPEKNEIFMLSKIIGKQLRIIRKSQGLSGKIFGDMVGVSQQQISRYECGVCRLDVDILIHLLSELDISLDEFFLDVSYTLKNESPKKYLMYKKVFTQKNDINNQKIFALSNIHI